MYGDLTTLLPAYNEAPSIERVIEGIKESLPGCRILVVNNGSINGTDLILKKLGVTVLDVPKKGKGNAIRAGLEYIDTPYVVMMDSDDTYPHVAIPLFYSLLGFCDVVVGNRSLLEVGSMTSLNRFGNRALSLLASTLYGRKVEDVCTGMWGFRKEALDRFQLTSEGFTLEAELFINAIRNNCSIQQVPILYSKRVDGSSPKLKVWDGFRIGWFLTRRRFR